MGFLVNEKISRVHRSSRLCVFLQLISFFKQTLWTQLKDVDFWVRNFHSNPKLSKITLKLTSIPVAMLAPGKNFSSDFNTRFSPQFMLNYLHWFAWKISERLQSDKLVFNFDREFHAQFKPPQTENQQRFNINFACDWRILVKTKIRYRSSGWNWVEQLRKNVPSPKKTKTNWRRSRNSRPTRRSVEINPKQFYFPLSQSAGENFHREHQQKLFNFAVWRLIKLFTAANSRNSLFSGWEISGRHRAENDTEMRVLGGEKTIELPNRSFQKFISQSMLSSIFCSSTILRYACCE